MRAGAADLARWWQLAPSGQAVVDEQGIILFANLALCDWLGQPMRLLADRPASELFTPEARMLYLGLLAYRVAERGEVDEVHLTLRLENGAPLPVLCSARQVEHKGARLTLLSMLPIARKDRLEREMWQAHRAAQQALEEKNVVIAELEALSRTLKAQREELETLRVMLGRMP